MSFVQSLFLYTTMKHTSIVSIAASLLAGLLWTLPSTAVAQAAPAKSSSKASTAKAQAPKKTAKPKAKPVATAKPSSRVLLHSAAKNVAAGIEAAEAALTPEELAIAERVQVGLLPCELGASVNLSPDHDKPGYFDVSGKNFKFRMFPVPTTTGAVRLEDRKAGAVWLQLANKSMLMNQKNGTRLADECISVAQAAVIEEFKRNPPVNLLDTPAPMKASVATP